MTGLPVHSFPLGLFIGVFISFALMLVFDAFHENDK